MKPRIIFVPFIAIIFLFVSGCGGMVVSQQPDLQLTAAVQALQIQQTTVAVQLTQASLQNPAPPAVIVVTATTQPGVPVNTVGPAPTLQPQIVNSTLCWVGPGAKYEVVSSIKQGEYVQVIGRGNTPGWIIIKNPRYSDPCWLQSTDIKLDPGFDLNSLQVYYPPPLPTNTPTPVPTATPV